MPDGLTRKSRVLSIVGSEKRRNGRIRDGAGGVRSGETRG